MKKRLLLFVVMVIAIMSIFAISASCAVIYNTADGTELFRYVDENADYDYDSYSGEFPKFDANNNALTWYITATETVDGDTVHTVASKITLGEAGSINANGAYSFTSPVTNKNTVSVNFPDNAGIKTWAFKSFGGYGSRNSNNILFVYCPNTLTAFENNPFQETNVIVVELDDETPIISIPQNFAHEARNLETINIPASVTIINGDSGKNGAPFYNGYSLTSVTFASMNNLITMKKSVFANCTSLKTIKLPNSVTEIGERCFENCKSLESANLGASVTSTTGYSVFRLCNSLKVYYIPSTLVSIYQHTFTHDSGSGPANTVFFYAGTKAEFELFYNAAVSGKNNERVTSGYKAENVIEWDPTKPDSYYTELATTNSCKYYVYGYNKCEAFYNGNHGFDTDCTTADACQNGCGLTNTKNESHNNGETLTFANGLTAEGVHSVGCKNDGCTVKTNTTVKPVFTAKGYSTNADKNAINGGYEVNPTSLALYERLIGELEYGIVIANAKSFGENSFFDENKRVNSEKALQVEIDSQYASFDCSINFGANTGMELDLVICAYVIEGDTVTYIQSSTGDDVTIGGESFKSVTLAQVVALVPAVSKEN